MNTVTIPARWEHRPKGQILSIGRVVTDANGEHAEDFKIRLSRIRRHSMHHEAAGGIPAPRKRRPLLARQPGPDLLGDAEELGW